MWSQILIHVVLVCLSSRNGNRVRQIDIELGCPETNIDPEFFQFLPKYSSQNSMNQPSFVSIINDGNKNLPSLLFLSKNITLATLLIQAVRRTRVIGAHRGVSVVQWLEYRSGESEGLRFDSSWGLRIFSSSRVRDKTKKTSFSIINDVTLLWTTTGFWATNATFP